MPQQNAGYLARPQPSGLADVVETVLDKGLVIDTYVRVSLLGMELLTVDARVVVSSVDTFLRFAEATDRLDLWEKGGRGLPDLVSEETDEAVGKVASTVVEHQVDDALDRVGDAMGEPAENAARATGREVVRGAAEVGTKAAEHLRERAE